MKNKLFKMLLTATLCTAMIGSTCFAASTPGTLTDADLGAGQTITGNSTVENPVYKVVVPTTLSFAVDPFEQKGQSQIYSPEFSMINKSNVAVSVNAAITVTAATGTTLKDAETDVKETDNTKLVYMAVQVPSAVTGTVEEAAAYETSITKVGDKYYADPDGVDGAAGTETPAEEMVDTTAATGNYATNVKVALESGKADCLFVLNKAAYTEYYADKNETAKLLQFKECAAGNAGVASFRFSGKVNSKAAWAASDLSATIKFTFNGLSDASYTELIAKKVADSHQLVSEESAPVFSSNDVGVVTWTAGSGDLALKSITSMTAPYNGKATEFYKAATKSGNTATLTKAYVDAWAAGEADPEATVTYVNEKGETKTATFTLKCKE